VHVAEPEREGATLLVETGEANLRAVTQVNPIRPRDAMEVASLPKMMKPDIGGEAMSTHLPDLPGWLGTARRDRSVEEPGRPGRAGEGQPDPNGAREYITEGRP
jgi:hypothetical protein